MLGPRKGTYQQSTEPKRGISSYIQEKNGATQVNRLVQAKILESLRQMNNHDLAWHFIHAVTADAPKSRLRNFVNPPQIVQKPAPQGDPLNLLAIRDALLHINLLYPSSKDNNLLLELAKFMECAHKHSVFSNKNKLNNFLILMRDSLSDYLYHESLKNVFEFIAWLSDRGELSPNSYIHALEYKKAQALFKEVKSEVQYWISRLLLTLFKKRYESPPASQWELPLYHLSRNLLPSYHRQVVSLLKSTQEDLEVQAAHDITQEDQDVLNAIKSRLSPRKDHLQGITLCLRYAGTEIKNDLITALASSIRETRGPGMEFTRLALSIESTLGHGQGSIPLIAAITDVCSEHGVHIDDLSLSAQASTHCYKMGSWIKAAQSIKKAQGQEDLNDAAIKNAKSCLYKAIAPVKEKHSQVRSQLQGLMDAVDAEEINLLDLAKDINPNANKYSRSDSGYYGSEDGSVQFSASSDISYNDAEQMDPNVAMSEQIDIKLKELASLRQALVSCQRPEFDHDEGFKIALLSKLISNQNFDEGEANFVTLDYGNTMKDAHDWHRGPEKAKDMLAVRQLERLKEQVNSLVSEINDTFIPFAQENHAVQHKIQRLNSIILNTKDIWKHYKDNHDCEYLSQTGKGNIQSITQKMDSLGQWLAQCCSDLEQLLKNKSPTVVTLQTLRTIAETINAKEQEITGLAQQISALREAQIRYQNLCNGIPVWKCRSEPIKAELNRCIDHLQEKIKAIARKAKVVSAAEEYFAKRKTLREFNEKAIGKIGVYDIRSIDPQQAYKNIQEWVRETGQDIGVKLSREDIDKLSIYWMQKSISYYMQRFPVFAKSSKCYESLEKTISDPLNQESHHSAIDSINQYADNMKAMQSLLQEKTHLLPSSNRWKRFLYTITGGRWGRSMFGESLQKHTTSMAVSLKDHCKDKIQAFENKTKGLQSKAQAEYITFTNEKSQAEKICKDQKQTVDQMLGVILFNSLEKEEENLRLQPAKSTDQLPLGDISPQYSLPCHQIAILDDANQNLLAADNNALTVH